jgi:hypothetical protein
VSLTTPPPSVNRLCIQCGNLNISQPYRPPHHFTGIALVLYVDVRTSQETHLCAFTAGYGDNFTLLLFVSEHYKFKHKTSVLKERRYNSTAMYGVTYVKTIVFIVTARRTSVRSYVAPISSLFHCLVPEHIIKSLPSEISKTFAFQPLQMLIQLSEQNAASRVFLWRSFFIIILSLCISRYTSPEAHLW